MEGHRTVAAVTGLYFDLGVIYKHAKRPFLYPLAISALL
jgi:hypothetical protein